MEKKSADPSVKNSDSSDFSKDEDQTNGGKHGTVLYNACNGEHVFSATTLHWKHN